MSKFNESWCELPVGRKVAPVEKSFIRGNKPTAELHCFSPTHPALTDEAVNVLVVEHSKTIEQRIATTSAKKHLLFVLQISQGIKWIHTLVAGKLNVPTGTRPELKKWLSIASRLPELHMAVRTDASP